MQIRAEPEKSALPICNYSQILYQFLTFTQNLKRSHNLSEKNRAYEFLHILHYKANIRNPLLLFIHERSCFAPCVHIIF